MKKLALMLPVLLLCGCYIETLEHPQSGKYRPRDQAILTRDNILYLQAKESYIVIDLAKEFAKFSADGATPHTVSRKSPTWKNYLPGTIPKLADGSYEKAKVVMDWGTGYERDASLAKMSKLGFSQGDVVYLFDWFREDRRAWMYFRLYSKRFSGMQSTDFFVEVPVEIERHLRTFHIDG